MSKLKLTYPIVVWDTETFDLQVDKQRNFDIKLKVLEHSGILAIPNQTVFSPYYFTHTPNERFKGIGDAEYGIKGMFDLLKNASLIIGFNLKFDLNVITPYAKENHCNMSKLWGKTLDFSDLLRAKNVFKTLEWLASDQNVAIPTKTTPSREMPRLYREAKTNLASELTDKQQEGRESIEVILHHLKEDLKMTYYIFEKYVQGGNSLWVSPKRGTDLMPNIPLCPQYKKKVKIKGSDTLNDLIKNAIPDWLNNMIHHPHTKPNLV